MFSRDPLADPEELIRRVYAYVAYRMGDSAQAEDVVGETFERAIRYRESYDVDKGSPISWLTGIARRCISEQHVASSSSEWELSDVAAPGDLEHEVVERAELASAVRRLGERDRELIALRYGADLSARQIAHQLDLQTNAVEVALHRALGRLRSSLEDDRERSDVAPSGTL